LLWFVMLCNMAFTQVDGPFHNVMSYGASNDKEKVSTQAIQNAIDTCYFQGGGTVYFPPGEYCSGTIVLKDNVTLYLEAGATLYASRNINDYRMPLEDASRPVLLYANGAKNIAVKGEGAINGQAQRTYEELRETDEFIKDITENARASGIEMKRYYALPPDVALVIFFNCSDISVENTSLIESSFWTLHMVRCERIHIKGVYIYSDLEKGVNSDGIDINSSRDVVISDCIVTTGDDAIVLKTRYEDPCENVCVSNCILTSSSTALKLGTESKGDFRHIVFNNCAIRNSNRGLSIVVREGGHVEDVLFSNMTIECKRRHFNWWGNADPIWIFLTKKYPSSKVGHIKDVVFENILARGMGTSKIESTEGMCIENIQLNNVQLVMEQEDYADKRADNALYVHQVKNLGLTDLTVKWDEADTEKKWKSAVSVSQAEGVVIDNFRGRQGLVDSEFPVIDLTNASEALIRNCYPDIHSSTFVRVAGADSRNIVLQDNDPFKNARHQVEIERDVPGKSAVKMLD